MKTQAQSRPTDVTGACALLGPRWGWASSRGGLILQEERQPRDGVDWGTWAAPRAAPGEGKLIPPGLGSRAPPRRGEGTSRGRTAHLLQNK